MTGDATEEHQPLDDSTDKIESPAEPQWAAAAEGVTDDEGYLIGATRPTAKLTALQALRYAFFSLSAAGIQFLSTALLAYVWGNISHATMLSDRIFYLVGLIISIVWNFTVNRSFNFKSVVNVRAGMIKVLIYYVFFTPISTWWVGVLSNDLHWNYYLVTIGTIIINGATEFLVYRYAVFPKSMNTSKRGQAAQQAEQGE